MFTSLESFDAVPVVVLVAFLILMAIARPDRDDRGTGLYAVVLSAVGVAALYVLLVSGVACVSAVSQRAIVDRQASSEQGVESSPEVALVPSSALFDTSANTEHGLVQAAVFNGLFALGAGFVFGYQLRRRRELAADDDYEDGVADRVDRAYFGVIAFVAVVVGISAFAVAGYGGFRILAPDVAGSNDTYQSQLGLSQLIAYGALALTCVVIFRTHFWRVRSAPEPTEPIDS